VGTSSGCAPRTPNGPGAGYGFRVYRMTSSDGGDRVTGDELTVVYDDASGKLSGAITGDFLGAARTGAIGAVAVDMLARPDADTLALIGSGHQAWTQLWAISAVRPLRAVRVYSPGPASREAFARRAAAELGVPAVGVEAPAAAVDGAGIVVLATTSRQPVIEAGWVAARTHVSTLGPKTADAHECPPELADRAGVILTDSPAQIDASPERLFLSEAAKQRIGDLGAAAAGAGQRRESSDQITLFLSVGLAGTEVAVAAELLRANR
jgi:alanine dehydrogenase